LEQISTPIIAQATHDELVVDLKLAIREIIEHFYKFQQAINKENQRLLRATKTPDSKPPPSLSVAGNENITVEIGYLVKCKLCNALHNIFNSGINQKSYVHYFMECAKVSTAHSQAYAHIILPPFIDLIAGIQQRDPRVAQPEIALRVLVCFLLK